MPNDKDTVIVDLADAGLSPRQNITHLARQGRTVSLERVIEVVGASDADRQKTAYRLAKLNLAHQIAEVKRNRTKTPYKVGLLKW